MDRAQIHHVAELAELELTDDEEEQLAAEIGRIVAYVHELDAVDTKDVPPTAHVTMPSATSHDEPVDLLRQDQPQAGLSQEEALSGAPRAAHGGFEVPTFVE